MQSGLALFDQLDRDGTFYFDKYRAIINYADLLFALGRTDEAIKQVSDAENVLKDYGFTETEVYAVCLYSLGLYHVCLNDVKAGNELLNAFRIFIDIYGRHSEYVQNKAAELQRYIEMANFNTMECEPLKQLLGE